MRLKTKILEQLNRRSGLTARELSKILGKDKTEINSCLYKMRMNGEAHIDDQYRWSSGPAASAPSPAHSETAQAQLSPCAKPNRFEPTSEQKPVIEAGAASCSFVEAGPGTGKTDSLVARLKWLSTSGGLNPSEILVLSFSVAAVRELRNRIERARSEGDGCLSFIDIRTFDSFASRLLRQWTSSSALREMDYDQRIRQLTTDLKTRKEALAAVRGYKHVLLDEVQDLVGVRADFALELLKATNCGFTLFGDSAQGIYDFQIAGNPSQTTSADLVKMIRNAFPALNDTRRFTKNFRVSGNAFLEEIALQGRALLLESPEKARAYLEGKFSSLTTQGSTGAPAIHPELLGSSTCVICRTNGQVLRLAGQLREKNIPFEIARNKNENIPPPWIGRMFLGWPEQDPVIRRQEFISRATAVLSLDAAQGQALWQSLVASLGLAGKPSFNVTVLRAAITDGAVLPEIPVFARDENVLQLSTIHKSKGREFPNVIIVMNTDEEITRGKGEDRVQNDAEPKVLFVALTRARNSLGKMEARAKGIWMPSERWIRSFPNSKGFKMLCGIQAGLPFDIDTSSFAADEPDEVTESQAFLLEHCRPGSPVELVFGDQDDKGCPIYNIWVRKINVGRMSTSFGWSLWHTLNNLNNPRNLPRYKPKSFPARITGLWVKEVVTVVGDNSDDRIDRAFQTSGLWLGITIDGLGNCEWNNL